eukprot:1827320-Pleurochrysis_carterae.AAC.1
MAPSCLAAAFLAASLGACSSSESKRSRRDGPMFDLKSDKSRYDLGDELMNQPAMESQASSVRGCGGGGGERLRPYVGRLG